MIENAHQTIIELKKEIEDLKNSLNRNVSTENPSDLLVETKNANITQTNDKIDVIERKFNAFETMYMESQDKFIESFRSLDERHKVYMDSIQETVKEIVEKSLGHHDETVAQDALETPKTENEYENEAESLLQSQNISHSKPEIELKASNIDPISSTDSCSQSGDDKTKIICQVDVHAVSSAETNLQNQDDELNSKKDTKISSKLLKEMALNEFEQRLHQLGVDADSTGLTTPRSCEVKQDLAEEREEMKKVCLILHDFR